jgi:chemotaxis protein CheC
VNEYELDRLSELANIGAGHAATAFSTLTGREIWMDVPRIREIGSKAEGDTAVDEHSAALDESWTTGVFFVLDGCLDAIVGIMFRARASEAVVRRVVGVEEGTLQEHCIESALMEVGNILASHVASAIADTLGERLLPSIPMLAMNHAEGELEMLLSKRPGSHPVRIECELHDADGEMDGLLLLVPEEARA